MFFICISVLLILLCFCKCASVNKITEYISSFAIEGLYTFFWSFIKSNLNLPISTLNLLLISAHNSSANLVVSTLITYYTDSSHKINFKITNATENKITGTFSGELYRENNMGNPVVVNITEGYFEAIRE